MKPEIKVQFVVTGVVISLCWMLVSIWRYLSWPIQIAALLVICCVIGGVALVVRSKKAKVRKSVFSQSVPPHEAHGSPDSNGADRPGWHRATAVLITRDGGVTPIDDAWVEEKE